MEKTVREWLEIDLAGRFYLPHGFLYKHNLPNTHVQLTVMHALEEKRNGKEQGNNNRSNGVFPTRILFACMHSKNFD